MMVLDDFDRGILALLQTEGNVKSFRTLVVMGRSKVSLAVRTDDP